MRALSTKKQQDKQIGKTRVSWESRDGSFQASTIRQGRTEAWNPREWTGFHVTAP
jgi:hypothetical protein